MALYMVRLRRFDGDVTEVHYSRLAVETGDRRDRMKFMETNLNRFLISTLLIIYYGKVPERVLAFNPDEGHTVH